MTQRVSTYVIGEDGQLPALQHVLQLLIGGGPAGCREMEEMLGSCSPKPQRFPPPEFSRDLLISSCLWILSLHRSRYLDWVALYSVITSTNLRDSVECWGRGEGRGAG